MTCIAPHKSILIENKLVTGDIFHVNKHHKLTLNMTKNIFIHEINGPKSANKRRVPVNGHCVS